MVCYTMLLGNRKPTIRSSLLTLCDPGTNVSMTPDEYLLRCLEKMKHLDDSVWSQTEDFESKLSKSSLDLLICPVIVKGSWVLPSG